MAKEKRTELVGVRVAPETKEELEEAAAEDDRTVSYLVNKIITEFLDSRRSTATPPKR